MPPRRNAELKAVKGPARELVARIKYLGSLLRNLPASLPENPPDSRYRFYLNTDKIEDRGHLGELSHALEVSFATHELRGAPIRFLQRRSSLEALPELLKTTPLRQGPADCSYLLVGALDRFCYRVRHENTSRKAPETVDADEAPTTEKFKPSVIVLDNSDDEMDSPMPHSLFPRPHPIFLHPSAIRNKQLFNSSQRQRKMSRGLQVSQIAEDASGIKEKEAEDVPQCRDTKGVMILARNQGKKMRKLAKADVWHICSTRGKPAQPSPPRDHADITHHTTPYPPRPHADLPDTDTGGRGHRGAGHVHTHTPYPASSARDAASARAPRLLPHDRQRTPLHHPAPRTPEQEADGRGLAERTGMRGEGGEGARERRGEGGAPRRPRDAVHRVPLYTVPSPVAVPNADPHAGSHDAMHMQRCTPRSSGAIVGNTNIPSLPRPQRRPERAALLAAVATPPPSRPVRSTPSRPPASRLNARRAPRYTSEARRAWQRAEACAPRPRAPPTTPSLPATTPSTPRLIRARRTDASPCSMSTLHPRAQEGAPRHRRQNAPHPGRRARARLPRRVNPRDRDSALHRPQPRGTARAQNRKKLRRMCVRRRTGEKRDGREGRDGRGVGKEGEGHKRREGREGRK
ncbi:hypothetical protein DFH09DRAFT_1420673 [Mycena vulgaris]|nr:hypothetical protein DFH09DRAFT_1420673 [Mycena vulgaris]